MKLIRGCLSSRGRGPGDNIDAQTPWPWHPPSLVQRAVLRTRAGDLLLASGERSGAVPPLCRAASLSLYDSGGSLSSPCTAGEPQVSTAGKASPAHLVPPRTAGETLPGTAEKPSLHICSPWHRVTAAHMVHVGLPQEHLHPCGAAGGRPRAVGSTGCVSWWWFNSPFTQGRGTVGPGWFA